MNGTLGAGTSTKVRDLSIANALTGVRKLLEKTTPARQWASAGETMKPLRRPLAEGSAESQSSDPTQST